MGAMNTPVNLLIIVVTVVSSLVGFRNLSYLQRNLLDVQRVLRRGEWPRVATSALLHADLSHLFFNMFSLWSFGGAVEACCGWWFLLAVYVAAVVGGSLLAILLHRQEQYRALGASGGVCGVIYAAIFLVPGTSVVVFPLPIPIPAWLFAILFVVVSFAVMRTRIGNIGHDAHLGGALVGLLVATALRPSLVAANPLLFATVVVITVVLLGVAYRTTER